MDPAISRVTQTGGSPAIWIGHTRVIWLLATADTGGGDYIIPAGTAIADDTGWTVYDESDVGGAETADFITLERVDLNNEAGTGQISKPVLVLVHGAVRLSGCIEHGPIQLAAAGIADLAKNGSGIGHIYFETA